MAMRPCSLFRAAQIARHLPASSPFPTVAASPTHRSLLLSSASATRLQHPSPRAYSQSKQKSHYPAGQDPKDTVFAKILAGTIPCKKVYEDDQVLAFHDIAPQAPVHVVVIPKKPFGGVEDFKPEDAPIIGHLMVSIPKIAQSLNLEHGYRLVVNQGEHGQQSVRWVHIHLLGGRQLSWPPG